MLDFINKAVTKIFGSKSEKDIKEVTPLVEQTKAEFAKLKSLSNDELRNKTVDFKRRIKEYVADIDLKIAENKKQVDDNPDMDPDEK